MLSLKIENGLIVDVVDAAEQPDGHTPVPDSFVFVSADVRYYDSEWRPKSEAQLEADGVIHPVRTVYSVANGERWTGRMPEIPAGFTEKEPQPGQVWDGDGWVTPPSVPLTLEQVQSLRRAAYVAEADPLKNEADYDAILNGTEPNYTAWLAAVAAIKARYPLPEDVGG